MHQYTFWYKSNAVCLRLEAKSEDEAWQLLENIIATDLPEHVVTIIDDKTQTHAELSIVNLGVEGDWELDEDDRDENHPADEEALVH